MHILTTKPIAIWAISVVFSCFFYFKHLVAGIVCRVCRPLKMENVTFTWWVMMIWQWVFGSSAQAMAMTKTMIQLTSDSIETLSNLRLFWELCKLWWCEVFFSLKFACQHVTHLYLVCCKRFLPFEKHKLSPRFQRKSASGLFKFLKLRLAGIAGVCSLQASTIRHVLDSIPDPKKQQTIEVTQPAKPIEKQESLNLSKFSFAAHPFSAQLLPTAESLRSSRWATAKPSVAFVLRRAACWMLRCKRSQRTSRSNRISSQQDLFFGNLWKLGTSMKVQRISNTHPVKFLIMFCLHDHLIADVF